MYAPWLGGGFRTDDFVHLGWLADAHSFTALFASTDAFGFYRPVTQASLKLDASVFGESAAGFRAVNLALHAGVIGAAFVVARLVSAGPLAAALATIAFALTPKAHPTAVLWVSGRAELLMALFSFVATAGWIVWSRNGRAWWLAVATAAYIAAVASKETAFLLPLLFLATPSATRPWRLRCGAVLMLLGVSALMFVWRSKVGALPPFSADEHYTLATGVARIVRSIGNYTPRMAPAPAALVILIGAAGFLASGHRTEGTGSFATTWLRGRGVAISLFSLAWVAVFLAPVLPIVLRSELYLYLPVFGGCVLAASIADSLMRGVEKHRAVVAAIGFWVIGLGVYQMARSVEVHRDHEFSARFVAALRERDDLAGQSRPVAVVPGDARTERFLKDAIDWTLPAVLHVALGGRPRATIEYTGMPATPNAIRLACEYRDGTVTLRRLGP